MFLSRIEGKWSIGQYYLIAILDSDLLTELNTEMKHA